MQYEFYAYAIIAGFTSAFLRGMQTKNVSANLKTLSFGTGWLMGISDVAIFALVSHMGFIIGIFSGFGLGMGYVLSILIHKRLMKKREQARKAKKQSKLDARIEQAVERILAERNGGEEY